MKKFISICCAAAILSTATGCFGGFKLTKNLLSWNESVTNSKFVNNLVFYGLVILPVYEFAVAADFLVLNLIEYWTGANPLAMEEGKTERQIIPLEGEDYIVEASKNQFKIYKEAEEPVFLRFDESDNSWTYLQGSVSEKLISYNETENLYHIYKESSVVSLKADTEYSKAFLASLLRKKN